MTSEPSPEERLRQVPYARARWFYLLLLAVLATGAGGFLVIRSFVVGANDGTGMGVLLLFIAYPLGYLTWRSRSLSRPGGPVAVAEPSPADTGQRSSMSLWLAAVGMVLLAPQAAQRIGWLAAVMGVVIVVSLVRAVVSFPSIEDGGKSASTRARFVLAVVFSAAFCAFSFLLVHGADGLWPNVFAALCFAGSALTLIFAVILLRAVRARMPADGRGLT